MFLYAYRYATHVTRAHVCTFGYGGLSAAGKLTYAHPENWQRRLLVKETIVVALRAAGLPNVVPQSAAPLGDPNLQRPTRQSLGRGPGTSQYMIQGGA